MNVPLLRQIQDKIRESPEQFDMSTWDCGTAACIAGWAYRFTSKLKPIGNKSETIWTIAKQEIGLTTEESSRLFLTNEWPTEFISDLVPWPTTTPELAIARIDHFIQTEGRE